MKKLILSIVSVFLLLPQLCIAETPEKPETLTVISYNIRMGKADDGTNSWKYRYPASAMMITDQAPDIFGVQEAFDFQVKYLSEYCKGYKSVGVGREDGKNKGEHMSIFYKTSKIHLIKWGTFWLSETPDTPSKGWDAACYRTATWALMKDKETGKKFYYVNTHLDHKGVEARRKGLLLIVDKIKSINPKSYPMVLTGDFNITPDNPALKVLNERMQSARKTAVKTDDLGSFNDWGREKEKKIIDYIYYSGFSCCTDFQTIVKKYYGRTYISDHFPVKAVLVF
ncbi:MAG: endonuclease/exonuclease/phosphatase family protein [Bacteroidales bacterium]|jgi:endonuclease/exonuclease/phosphatase family metal-dependent hydrolase|nr:endonuclease/exonuclease/phosphatase family protein [Bacteroidales bacterium]MCI1784872.1 endonuclease/exonuclease/phosphatase family protein [Bacteroidales bacterium]